MAGEPNPLELASDDELIDELRRRYRCMLFVGTRPTKVAKNGEDEVLCRWGGSRTWTLGLAEHARARLAPPSLDTTDAGG